MSIPTQTIPDANFGGASEVVPVKQDRHEFPQYPEIDLAPFALRYNTLRLEAMNKWYQRWRDISRYINPKRGSFEGYIPNYNAQIDYKLIIDGAPQRAARILAAGMSSGLTSPSHPWFRLGLEDKDMMEFQPNKEWLSKCSEIMRSIIARSNMYGAYHQMYEELGMFGTAAMGIYEDYETVIRARAYTCGEYFLGNDHNSRVNTFARTMWMTVDNVVQKFGWVNCSKLVQNAYRAGNRDIFIQMYLLCEPNTTQIHGAFDFRGKKYREVIWEAQSVTKKALRIGGYDEFPNIGTRWDLVTTADTYGTGPGWYALGDIKSLYRLKKDSLMGLAKKVDPPVVIGADVEGNANLLPGGVTRSSATVDPSARAAYQVDIDLADSFAVMQGFKQDIGSAFYTDLFMSIISMSDDGKKTAMEIAKRYDEKLLMIGPVLERVQSEMLDPSIERVFGVAMRAGLLPPPPPEIQGMPWKVEYISTLAQAQKMVGTAAIEQTASFIGSLSAIYPEVKDVFNADEATRSEADMLGTPPRMIRSEEEVQAIRDARAKQMQAAEAQQQAMAMADGAKVMSETKVGGGASALDHILGTQGEAEAAGSV